MAPTPEQIQARDALVLAALCRLPREVLIGGDEDADHTDDEWQQDRAA